MKALKILAILLGVLLLLAFVTVTFLGGPIARAVVKSLNKNLQTEIVIADYDVTLLATFPNLSVKLSDVQVEGSDGSELLIAEEVFCLLDVGSLFGKIRVEEIVVEDGKLQLLTDVDGNTNYQLTGYTPVGEQASALEGEATEFNIAEARLRGVEVVYRDEQLELDLTGNVEFATFSGDFGTDNYLLSTDAKLEIYYLDQAGDRLLNEQALILTSQTGVDNLQGKYTFAPLRVEAGDLEFSVVGELTSIKEGLRTDLRIESASGSLEDVIALIPPVYAGGLPELETRGELALAGSIIGDWTQERYPKIDGSLTFTDGRVGSPRTNVGVRDLNLKARFAYLDGPRGGVQSVAIEELTGLFRKQPFTMGLEVQNLEDPRVDFRAEGALPLGVLPAVLGEGPITEGDGLVRIEGLRIRGRYEDMLRPRTIAQVAAAGRLTFEDGELTVNERELSFPSGTLELRNNELELTDLAFSGPGTEISFTGRATNLIPVLFADSLNTQDAELNFDARLTGESVDIDELLSLAGPTEEEEEIAAAAGTTDSLRAKTMVRRAR
ncbi:MAG: AsmA family protein, partial [Bacteroidota bacterium]